MSITVHIPQDAEKLKQSIVALEYQLEHDADEQSREIHRQALSKMKNALEEQKYAGGNVNMCKLCDNIFKERDLTTSRVILECCP